MATYTANRQRRRLPRRVWLVVVGLIILLIVAVAGVRHVYYDNLNPVSSDQKTVIVTIPSGSSVKQIASILHDQRLIRSAWAFEWYAHSKELSSKLQAGTYALSPSENIPTIAQTLTKGKVATRLVTIIPGKRLDQVRADLINDGFSPTAVDNALLPSRYADLPVLAYKPGSINTLEGLLFPDSFQRNADTDPAVIVRESLIEMGKKLTPDLQAAFAKQGLSPYQGLTLASIVEQEIANPDDGPKVAQVFLKRLHSNMTLGSDVTAHYGAILAGKKPSVDYASPYNTRIHKGLPPSPIGAVSLTSLNAVAHPAPTDWLYFVAGDDGKTYFSMTLEQHNQNVQLYCHKLCHTAE
jgi:UPF0755 protein